MELEKQQVNKYMYNNFLKTPMKGAVTNMQKHRFTIWFTNDEKIEVRKANRYSHKQLKLGDVEEFVIRVVQKEDKKPSYILDIVGKNNMLIPRDFDNLHKSTKKQKKTPLRTLNEGKHIIRIYYIDDKRTTMSVDGNEMTIYTPLIFREKRPPTSTDLIIEIEHRTRNQEGVKSYISGHIISWNQFEEK